MKAICILVFLFAFLRGHAQKKEPFYPDGYYFPQSTIKIKNFEFEWLSIFIEPNNGSKPTVSLRLSDVTTGKFINIDSYKYSITKDKAIISFSYKSLGDITITGRYTISKPPFDNKEVKCNTIVFIGDLFMNKRSYPLKFSWGEGD